jgi:hypothetical protein
MGLFKKLYEETFDVRIKDADHNYYSHYIVDDTLGELILLKANKTLYDRLIQILLDASGIGKLSKKQISAFVKEINGILEQPNMLDVNLLSTENPKTKLDGLDMIEKKLNSIKNVTYKPEALYGQDLKKLYPKLSQYGLNSDFWDQILFSIPKISTSAIGPGELLLSLATKAIVPTNEEKGDLMFGKQSVEVKYCKSSAVVGFWDIERKSIINNMAAAETQMYADLKITKPTQVIKDTVNPFKLNESTKILDAVRNTVDSLAEDFKLPHGASSKEELKVTYIKKIMAAATNNTEELPIDKAYSILKGLNFSSSITNIDFKEYVTAMYTAIYTTSKKINFLFFNNDTTFISIPSSSKKYDIDHWHTMIKGRFSLSGFGQRSPTMWYTIK